MKKNEEKEVKKEKVVDTTVSEIVTLNNKIKELEEKVLYKDAELLNYKKRKDLEVSSMLKYANSDIILEMLSIVDDLERAIKLDDNILDDIMDDAKNLPLKGTERYLIRGEYNIKKSKS